MPENVDRFAALALSVSDGTPIDWEAAESNAATDSERRRIRDLRVVAEITQIPDAPAIDAPPPEQWGPLRVAEPIGRGRFGRVYRAWDRRLDREVAVKFLARSSPGDTPTAAEFIEEGRLLAKVQHPSVVTVYGAERIDDVVGVWMELIRGRTLEQELTANGPFSAKRASAIGSDVARALEAVHAAGLVHRDVKAQNVMSDADGRIVLMDFGTGQDLASTCEPEIAGTPIYLAPEVLEGKPATARSDIYSVGVLIYHLVTGAFPVAGRTLGELRLAHQRGTRPSLKDGDPGIPAALAQILDRALAADPSARFETAAGMADAFDHAGAGAPPPNRRKSGALSIVLAIAAVGVIAVIARGLYAENTVPADALVCDGCKIDMEPSVSIDGRVMAYVEADTGDVVLRDLASGRNTTVAKRPAPRLFDAVLSRDGRQIAAARTPENNWDLAIASAGVNAVFRRLAGPGLPRAWSPNGNAVLADMIGETDAPLEWISIADGTRTVVARLGPCNVESRASVSPDGKWIAYDCATAVQAGRPSPVRHPVMLIPAGGGEPRPLTVAGGRESAPVWASNEDRVYFKSDVSGKFDLWSVTVTDGQSAAPLLERRDIGSAIPVAATKDGRVFLHQAEPGVPEATIATSNARGAASSESRIVGSLPTWSPDGQAIAVFRRSVGDSLTLIVHSLIDGKERTYRHDRLAVPRPLWYGDGKHLLVLLSGVDKAPGHWARLSLDTGEFEELAANRGDPHVLTHWSIRALAPDGGTLYFGTYRSQPGPIDHVVALDLRTGAYRTVVTLPGPEASLPQEKGDLALAIDPNGKTLAIEVANPKTRATTIWSVSVDGSGLHSLSEPFQSPYTISQRLAWTTDGRFLVYAAASTRRRSATDEPFRWMRLGATGGTPEFVDEQTGDWDYTLTANSDGTRIAFDAPRTNGARDHVWAITPTKR